jgi:hypothetical protein
MHAKFDSTCATLTFSRIPRESDDFVPGGEQHERPPSGVASLKIHCVICGSIVLAGQDSDLIVALCCLLHARNQIS